MTRSVLAISSALQIATLSPSSAWARGGSCGKSLLCDISAVVVLCFIIAALVGAWLSKRNGRNSTNKQSKQSSKEPPSVIPAKDITP